MTTTTALARTTPDLSWQDHALCLQVGSEAFYPDSGDSPDAKRICAACPVTDACLAYALDHDEQFGIWGGLSTKERRKLRAPITCPLCGDTFTSGYTRDRHIVGRHNPAQLHACPLCGQTFPYPAFLKRHVQAHHRDETAS